MDSEIFYEGWMVKSPPQKRSSHGYPLIKKVRNTKNSFSIMSEMGAQTDSQIKRHFF